ncbi:285_t:CDS:1, partial [Ambispora gerdemannii]
ATVSASIFSVESLEITSGLDIRSGLDFFVFVHLFGYADSIAKQWLEESTDTLFK